MRAMANASAQAAATGSEEPHPQVNIQVKNFQMTGSNSQPNALLKSDMPTQEILTEEQSRHLISEWEQEKGVDLLGSPDVTTISERQAQMATVVHRSILFPRSCTEIKSIPYGHPSVFEIAYEPSANNLDVITKQVATGTTTDVIPFVQDGAIKLDFATSWVSFLGYQKTPVSENPTPETMPIPILRFLQATNSTVIFSGQSVKYGPFYYNDHAPVTTPSPQANGNGSGDVESAAAIGGEANGKPLVKQAICILVTATLIDPADNPLASAASASGQ